MQAIFFNKNQLCTFRTEGDYSQETSDSPGLLSPSCLPNLVIPASHDEVGFVYSGRLPELRQSQGYYEDDWR
jgi:hypothetical protein